MCLLLMGIRILLADDHHVVRWGVKQLLSQEPDLSITGEAENGQEVLDLLDHGVEVDVLLTDLSMPVMDGIHLAKILGEKYPDLKIALLTIQEEECYIQQAFQAGIKSYIFKSADPQELIHAVKQVARGKPYLCSGVSSYFINRFSSIANSDKVMPADIKFSERELDVLRLIAEGYTNEEAADKLFTSRRTVEGHRQAMIDKTGSRNSLALVRFAVQHGLVN
jgi:two-component system response regulator NreC